MPGAVNRVAIKVFVPGLFLILFVAQAGAHFNGKGHIHELSERRQVFRNRDCLFSDTCDLKRFALTTTAYEVWFSDDPEHPTYGKGAIIEYETGSVAALERYAVVQFKKGCVYYSHQTTDNAAGASVRDHVPSFGVEVPFCFSDWVIDSQDTDPVYNSDPEHGRFYLLRWNRPGSFEKRSERFYGAERPKRPAVYLADYPAGAFVTGTGVRNVALAFRTCIYKAADVPAATHRDDVDFASPIHCFEWDNVYVYDDAARVFQATWPSLPLARGPESITSDPAPSRFGIMLVALAVGLLLLLGLVFRRRIFFR